MATTTATYHTIEAEKTGHHSDHGISQTNIDADSDDPARKVLEMYELIEMILLRLYVAPLAYKPTGLKLHFSLLMRMRAVARQWQQVIESSVALRRMLFLAAPTSGPMFCDAKWTARRREQYENPVSGVADYFDGDPKYARTPFDFHPAFKYGVLRPWHYTSMPILFSLTERRVEFSIPEDLDFVLGAGPVYRAQILTQPPVTAVRMQVKVLRKSGDLETWATIWDPKGITLGLVAETLKRVQSSMSYKHEQGDSFFQTMAFRTQE